LFFVFNYFLTVLSRDRKKEEIGGKRQKDEQKKWILTE